MYKLALTLDSAVLTVRKARGVIYPNPGFMKQLKAFERKLKLLRYEDNQQARFLEDYTTVSNRMKKAQIDMVTAGLSSDFYQMNKNTTKDRMGNFGIILKGLPNIKPLPVVRDERADFGKATVKEDQYATRWLHKLDEKPHTYFANEFRK